VWNVYKKYYNYMIYGPDLPYLAAECGPLKAYKFTQMHSKISK